jgi:hypothetical protein
MIAVLFFRRNISAELHGFRGFGLVDVPVEFPASAADWFALFERSSLLGLAMFDFFDLVNYFLVGLIFLALYAALRRSCLGAMMAATALALVGTGVQFASNQSLSMLALSDRHAAATEAQRAIYLASGEALLAIHQGTGSYLSLFLVTLAGLIASMVMLRGDVFGRATAWAGIVANGLALLYFPVVALMPVIGLSPEMAALPIVISAPFRILWYVLIAVGLLRLASR